ncbi:hypothetical protein SO802_024621 [Lithocarpus litseifolius]|uniref:CCHC-type domain-containing protein n=1 Tax=Lithocarpus litseifolius TaxID=425828 RepID=A0AAW2CB57_9ROSI
MSFTKNWYTKPTPPDIQFEERIFQSQFSVSADKLYEWNIDGLSEQEIINKMGHMSMVAITYMNNHDLDHPEIVELLSTGFSGTLRGWWDSYLTKDSRESIKRAVKMNDDGLPIFDEKRNSGIPDGVNTLIHTILKHFVGTLTNVSSRVSDYLNNLRCPTMSDYRWYHAVFPSRVMLRKDCKKPYWKEKFIDGLPPSFAHKVKQELIGKNDSIDYENLTYGDIFSTINKLGINMCNDEKLLKDKSKNRTKAKYEMGNFCEQYGLPPIAPSRQKKEKHDKSHKNIHHKKGRTNFVKPSDFYDKKKTVSKKYVKQNPAKGKCFNCGKPGHYSKDCKEKPGKLKNKLTMLNINDKDQEDLFKILESNNSSDSLKDDLSSSDSCYHSADESSDSPNIKLGCKDSCCNTIHSVNTLTKHEENEKLLLSLINQIQNPELQKEYLDKFKKNLTKNEASKKLKSTISFEEVLDRFNKKKPNEVTINELQLELQFVKQKIVNLENEYKIIKSDVDNVKQELLILKLDKTIDKQQSDIEQDELKEGNDFSQQALLSDTDPSLRILAVADYTTTTNKWLKTIRTIHTTSKWNIMSSSASRKHKGKAPAQDYPQDKRFPAEHSFVMHEGASSRKNPSRSTSLQEPVPAEVTFSNGDTNITLQEVTSKILQFHNGNFSDLPTPVKVLLDNLQAAYTINHRKLFKKTLQALEIHLVNLTAQNEVYEGLIIDISSQSPKDKPVNQPFPQNEAFASHSIQHDHYTSQLFGKEEIHSTDKMTLMGTDYAKLSLKTQFSLRCVVANLPSDIHKSILESKAMFRSFDLWYEYFKKLVTASIPDPDELDIDDNVFIQLDWEEYFGKSSRVYERKIHPFPGLLINYEDDELDEEDKDPDWLSQMFEFGFIRMIRVSNRDQLNQLPQIIQQAVARTRSPSILEVIQNLWKDYHFEGNTDRITVFGLKPYGIATQHLSIADYINPKNFTNPLKNPVYEHLLYCGFCNQYTTYHEHDCNNDPSWDPRDNYSDYCDTD